MKKYLFLIFLFSVSISEAQIKVKIYFEQIDDGFKIYADNDEFCPTSVKIDFTVLNYDIDGGNNNTYVIEALKKKQLITTLKVASKGIPSKFSYKYLTNYGNHNLNNFDENYVYDLPFKKSNRFKIYQGYNGLFSHQNENSLDFTMPIGTEISAIREGKVIRVVDLNNTNCGQEECKKYNNYVTVYHQDGTFAEYTHIQKNGSKVKVGETISKGQVIALSGNVGWSTGPHLHLSLFKQKLSGRETLKATFKTGTGDKTEYLAEKNEYSKEY